MEADLRSRPLHGGGSAAERSVRPEDHDDVLRALGRLARGRSGRGGQGGDDGSGGKEDDGGFHQRFSLRVKPP